MPLGKEVGLSSGDIVLDGDPAPIPTKKRHSPSFRPMSIVAKRSLISATSEHLLFIVQVPPGAAVPPSFATPLPVSAEHCSSHVRWKNKASSDCLLSQ